MEKETFKTAKEVAIECAKRKPKSYYSEPFEPHEWVIDAMEEYGQLCAEQARRKEQAKHNELLRYINDDIVGSWINGNPKNNLNRLFEQAGYKASPSGYEVKEENTK